MRSKGKSWKERICALLLALAMVLTGIMPGSAAMVEAAETVEITFDITDSAYKPLDNAKVTIEEVNNPDAEKQIVTKDPQNPERGYVASLAKDTQYKYTVENSGYVTKEGSFYTTDTNNTVEVEPLSLADIELLDDYDINAKMTAKDKQIIKIDNIAEGRDYECSSSDSTIINIVEDESGTSWTLEALKSGSATITISIVDSDKTKREEIKVEKIDLTSTLDLSVEKAENVKSINCSLSGFPDDVEGEVEFFIYNGENSDIIAQQTSKIEDSEDGNRRAEYSFSDDRIDNIKKVRVIAKYEGNEIYKSIEKTVTTGDLYENKDLYFLNGDEEETEVIVTFGEDEEIDLYALLDPDSILDRNIVFSICASEEETEKVVFSDQNGKVVPKHAGTVIIKATAEAKGWYTESSVYYKITINPGEAFIDDFEWPEQISKIYDGDNAIQISSENVLDDSEISKGYSVTIDAKLKDTDEGSKDAEDVGKKKNYKLTAGTYNVVDEDGNCDYTLAVSEEDTLENTSVSVTERPVYVEIVDTNIPLEYGRPYDVLKSEIEGQKNLVKLVGEDGSLSDDTESGYIDKKDMLKIVLPKATFDDSKKFETLEYVVGKTIDEIVIPNVDDTEAKAGDNYCYKFAEASQKGSIEFIRQKLSDSDILKYIYVPEDASNIDIRWDENTEDEARNISEIWVSRSANLKLDVKDEYSKYYDTVKVKIAGDTINATLNGISFKDYIKEDEKTQIKDISAEIWLEKSEYPETYTIRDSSNDEESYNGFNNIIKVDTQAPITEFGDLGTAGIIAPGMSAITFGLFDTEKYVQTVEISEKEDNEGLEGSGIAKKEYYIWKLGENITDTDLQYDPISQKIQEVNVAPENTEEGWTEFSGNEIPVGRGSTKTEIENNYVLFVRTTDKVGNTDIYASNGIVIEGNSPSIAVSFNNGDEKAYYNEDLSYSILVDDTKDSNDNLFGYKSGIDYVEVTIKEDGSTVAGDSESHTDSYTFYPEDEEDRGYSINEINELSEVSIKGTITANSNDVQMEVRAVDKAGNETTWEKSLIIDKDAPEITVNYNDKEIENFAVNDIYFQNARTMVITYNERNIEKNPDAKKDSSAETYVPGIRFDLVLNEIEYEDVTLSELEKFGIEWVEQKIEDTQGDYDEEKNYTEARSCSLELKFANDGRYEIEPKCVDRAGNESIADKQIFVIDTQDPVINVTYTVGGEESTDVDNATDSAKDHRFYTQDTVVANITITEKNFWLTEGGTNHFSSEIKQSDFSKAEGTEASDDEIEKYEYAQYEYASTWEFDGERAYATITFFPDANYTLGFTYTDLAGRSCEYMPRYFTIDQTPPEGAITVIEDGEQTIWQKFFDAITFNKFSNKNISVQMSGTDVTSGVEKLEYYNSDIEKSKEDIEALDDSAWTPYEQYEIAPDNQFIPYLRVTDYAGNVDYFTTESGFVVDATEPQIDFDCTNLNEARNEIFNESVGSVDFSISAYDIENTTYSGIDKIYYSVQASGNANGSISKRELFGAETEADRTQNREERNVVFSVPISDQFNSNDVIVTAYAEDLSGNEITKKIPIKIDTKAPEITVQYNSIPAVNGDYYNATRVATVTIRERNFDPSGVRFSITNSDGVQPSISGWSPSGNVGVSDNETHTCTVTFAADGDYTFTLSATDLAGNTTSLGRVDEFTIDQTDPTIQVSYDNNNDAEPGYFNASRTATVTINEHNFNAADVNAMITASLQGSGASAPGLSGWTTRGDSHTATVTFSSDADYTFDIDYTDLAGNAAADYTQDSFTVDQTAPEIEFFDITDKSANKGEVAPGVRYSDINYMESGVEITLTGANNGDEAVDGIRSSIPNGQSIKLEDFAHEKEVDDLYTMTAVVTDRAGNETEQSVMFSVNRFGSVYVMSNDTQELLDKVYTNEEQDLVVTEINVDSLVFNGISSGRDGNLTTLTEGEDYTVRESGAEDSWKQYTYTIDKENFETEGNYTVTIESEDQAENLSSTQVKKVQSPTDETQLYELEFAVDKTAPTVVLTGIEDGGQYRSNVRDVTVNTSDNIAMGDVKVYLGNSDEATTFSAEDIQAADGELTYTIPSSNTRQDIRAVATDAAGNTSETEINRVLVTSNLFVQFYSNTPLLAGSIAGVVVIAAALWYFLIFKRKKDEEKQANRR